MVSFKLGKEFEKYVFRLVTSVGQSLSPHEESNLWPSDTALWCSNTEPQWLYVSSVMKFI